MDFLEALVSPDDFMYLAQNHSLRASAIEDLWETVKTKVLRFFLSLHPDTNVPTTLIVLDPPVLAEAYDTLDMPAYSRQPDRGANDLSRVLVGAAKKAYLPYFISAPIFATAATPLCTPRSVQGFPPSKCSAPASVTRVHSVSLTPPILPKDLPLQDKQKVAKLWTKAVCKSHFLFFGSHWSKSSLRQFWNHMSNDKKDRVFVYYNLEYAADYIEKVAEPLRKNHGIIQNEEIKRIAMRQIKKSCDKVKL